MKCNVTCYWHSIDTNEMYQEKRSVEGPLPCPQDSFVLRAQSTSVCVVHLHLMRPTFRLPFFSGRLLVLHDEKSFRPKMFLSKADWFQQKSNFGKKGWVKVAERRPNLFSIRCVLVMASIIGGWLMMKCCTEDTPSWAYNSSSGQQFIFRLETQVYVTHCGLFSQSKILCIHISLRSKMEVSVTGNKWGPVQLCGREYIGSALCI